MRPTEDEFKRYHLVQAVVLLLQQFGLVSGDYRAIGRAEWKSKAPSLFKKGLLTPSSHLPEADPDRVFTKIQGCGLHVNTAGKTISYDGFWRSFQNLVRLRCWPHEDSLVAIVDVALAARTRHGAPAAERNALRHRALDFLIGYRSYLESTEEAFLGPGEYLRRHAPAGACASLLSTDRQSSVSITELLVRIDAAIAYLERYLRHCDSSLHRQIFGVYAARLALFRARALEECEYDGVRSFLHLAEEVRRFSFQTEGLLLKASLERCGQLSINFSDSGFADSGGRRAVWSEEPERVEILRLLRSAKRANRLLSLHRILLLDSVKSSDYTPDQILTLSRDIIALNKHGINVLLEDKAIAREIDHDLFNYAISEDGTIMRASEGHGEWRIAKVSCAHREYQRLLENYRTMTSEDCGRILRFDAAADLGRRQWPPPSNTDLRHSATFDKLADWMAG